MALTCSETVTEVLFGLIHSANIMAAPTCIICMKSDSLCRGRLLMKKGINTLHEVSQQRNDKLHEKISHLHERGPFVHNECYRAYTSPEQITCSKKALSSHEECRPSTPTLRSEKSHFDYPTHCLICAEYLDFAAARRHPSRHSGISSIEIVSKDKKSVIQENLERICDQRQDNTAVNLKARIAFAGDLRAVEAKYHRKCMQSFMTSKCAANVEMTQVNTRNLDSLNDDAFSELCQWLTLPDQRDQQFTLTELRKRLGTYLPYDVPAYSNPHIKRRLVEHFGAEVTISTVDGKCNIVTLKTRAASILHESYIDTTFDTDIAEDIRQAEIVGSNIRKVLQNIKQPNDVYPTPADVDLDLLESYVPACL